MNLDNEKQMLEDDLKNERLKTEKLGKNNMKFESLVKELIETNIKAPSPKKGIYLINNNFLYK